MGAEFWEYVAPYRDDVDATLDDLRRREFAAGRYHLAHLRPATIAQAFANTGADGTRSILDMERVAPSPAVGAVAPMPRAALLAIFGTDRPTRPMLDEALRSPSADAVEAVEETMEGIGRGEGRYILLYEDDHPTEIYFCGYSYD